MKSKLLLAILLIWGISVAQDKESVVQDSSKNKSKINKSEKVEKVEEKSDNSTKAALENKNGKRRKKEVVEKKPVKLQDASTAVEIDAGVMFGEFQREDGPFLLKGNIIVPSGQLLKFGPGCQVYVGGKYTTITVFGQIELAGTANEPVIIQSASKNPNPWDWDRIYIRSRRRSTIEHAVIRHSNYGVVTENSSVVIKNSIFEKNSIHGLVVKNSNVRISNSEFRKGHVVSVLLQAGADVSADSISIRNNRCGIACGDKAFFVMKKGMINGNRYGLAVDKGASVEIIAADITKNSVGIMSTTEIPKKMAEMVYQNTTEINVVSQDEFIKLLKAPEEVKSVALPTTKKEVTVSKNFAPGFSALKEERVKTASFIGNVSLGADYYHPNSKYHPLDLDTTYNADSTAFTTSAVKNDQTKYPGEQGDEYIDGLVPKLVFFAQGKRGDLDVNMNADVEFNSWYGDRIPSKFNSVVFSTNLRDQHATVGDFYENISEPSISGRKLRGVKYTGSFWDMGRGNKRIDVHLALGQSEEKEDVGDHDKDVFGDVTDTSYSVRQQMTYVAMGNLRPIHNLTLTARGLISHDQDETPLISDPVQDDSVPDPISAATGGLGFDLKLLDGNMEVRGELNIGKHDTVPEKDWDDLAWYKPQIIPSLSTVFGELGDAVSDGGTQAYALDAGISGDVKGFSLDASLLKIGNEYYSAGNPYLENDRLLVSASAKREFSDKISSMLSYEFERTSISDELDTLNGIADPLNSNTIDLNSSYSFGENKPTLVADYGLQIQSNEDVTDSLTTQTTVDSTGDSIVTTIDTVEVPRSYDFIEIVNSGGIEIKQRFENGIDFSLKYNFRNTNDASVYKIDSENDQGDMWEHGIKAKFGFKVKRILRSKTSFKIKFKNEVEDSVEEVDWKLTENLKIDIIPRKLKLTLKGDLRNKTSEEDSGEIVGKRDEFTTLQKTLEAELKFIINSKLSATLTGKIEDYDDDVSGSTENYTLQSGGLHFIYLF